MIIGYFRVGSGEYGRRCGIFHSVSPHPPSCAERFSNHFHLALAGGHRGRPNPPPTGTNLAAGHAGWHDTTGAHTPGGTSCCWRATSAGNEQASPRSDYDPTQCTRTPPLHLQHSFPPGAAAALSCSPGMNGGPGGGL